MKINQSYDDHISGDSWRILGDLELAVSSDADSAISIWLTETLSQLYLQVDFLNKVIKSAQDAVAHVSRANTMMAFKHFHLLVFAPAHGSTKGQFWGFFRIEKIESEQTDIHSPDHAIEFYLYQEG